MFLIQGGGSYTREPTVGLLSDVVSKRLDVIGRCFLSQSSRHAVKIFLGA